MKKFRKWIFKLITGYDLVEYEEILEFAASVNKCGEEVLELAKSIHDDNKVITDLNERILAANQRVVDEAQRVIKNWMEITYEPND